MVESSLVSYAVIAITIVICIFAAIMTFQLAALRKRFEPEEEKEVFDFDSFIQANNLPITQSLDNLNAKLVDLEKSRSYTDAVLSQQLGQLKETNEVLFTTTNTLSKVLSNSQSQGALGEMHLKTLLESCGLLEHADFELQVQVTSTNRPDCILNLPNGKSVVIDCKSPTKVLIDYLEADDSSKVDKLKKLNTSIKSHIRSLSDKEYQKDLPNLSEYVLMYLPSDSLLITAITADPSLVLYANSKNVVISSPSTIVPCLRNIEMLWRQENLNKNLEEVIALNAELHATAHSTLTYLNNVGKSLSKASEAHTESMRELDQHLKNISKLKDLSK